VLAFGTNEGFNDNLDIMHYRSAYTEVIQKIRAGAPRAHIVMIGPPDAERVAQPSCPAGSQNCAPRMGSADGQGCPYPTPPQIARVREAQREIARDEGADFWDWSSIQPSHCGANQWVNAAPKLMTPDHVHFTSDGYKLSAQKFGIFLTGLIDHWKEANYALSDN
jgi:lysophospholipase L1-like esterase